MFRSGDSSEHCRSWLGLRLPVDQQTRRRNKGGSKDDADCARVRNGPGDCTRCAKQNFVDRWCGRSRCTACLGAAVEPKHDQRSWPHEARHDVVARPGMARCTRSSQNKTSKSERVLFCVKFSLAVHWTRSVCGSGTERPVQPE